MINDTGGELIGISLAVNINLVYLNLRKNNLRVTAGTTFVKSVKENKSIRCLKLENNSINLNFLEQLEKYIKRNNMKVTQNNVFELKQKNASFIGAHLNAWKEVNE